jgi:hypothetical protein
MFLTIEDRFLSAMMRARRRNKMLKQNWKQKRFELAWIRPPIKKQEAVPMLPPAITILSIP